MDHAVEDDGKQRVVGSGCGKLLLFGEHAAVHGYPALGIGLPWKLTAQVDPAVTTADWVCENLTPADADRVIVLLARLEEVFPALGERGRGRVGITSTIPRGLGFGSSAALCVALVEGTAALIGGDTSRQELWQWAHDAERQFHGTPSGIDTGLAVFGGLQAFYPAPPQLPRRRELAGLPFHLAFGAVPRRDDTRSLVLGLGERVRQGDEDVKHHLARLGSIAEEAIAQFVARAGDALVVLGDLAGRAQESLRAIGLSSPYLEKVLAAGMEAGAMGGKLSGAGGGGAFFLLAEDEGAARRVAEAVRVTFRAEGIEQSGTVCAAAWSGGTARLLDG